MNSALYLVFESWLADRPFDVMLKAKSGMSSILPNDLRLTDSRKFESRHPNEALAPF